MGIEVSVPNNDLRSDWDSAGNRVTGVTNDPWIYDPVDGMLEVICDCDEHTVWLPKPSVGRTLPVCHTCAERRLERNTDTLYDNNMTWEDTP